MSWDLHHSKSEKYAGNAQIALKNGDIQRATHLYQRAAEAESLALSKLDPKKVKTLGITAISAASLWFKAGDLRKAEQVAYQYLPNDSLPPFAIDQLQAILQSVWNERVFRESGVEFAKGDVLVKVAGGEIVHGGAPLDLIHLKVDEVRGLFYRTIEMLLDFPLRRRGVPDTDIQQQFRPWLMQAPAGSYQFAVRVQKPSQLSLLPTRYANVEEVSQKVLAIIEATAQEKSDALEMIVPDPGYRDVFLKLTRNLAPTGKTFKTLELRSAMDIEARPVVLTPDVRQTVNNTIRARKTQDNKQRELKEEQISGILRALHLDKDWIEIVLPDNSHVHIHEAGDIIDDIIGPLVNHKVIIDVITRPDGRHLFRDIQSED